MNGGGDDDTAAISLYESFFELEDNLCIRYSGLNPFVVRREKVGEVLLLVRRMNAQNRRKNGIRKDDKVWIDKRETNTSGAKPQRMIGGDEIWQIMKAQ